MTAAGQESLKFRHITSIYSDDQGVSLKQPEGVACSDDGVLVVADTGNSRLLRYRLKDNTVERETLEFKVLQLAYPTRTAKAAESFTWMPTAGLCAIST